MAQVFGSLARNQSAAHQHRFINSNVELREQRQLLRRHSGKRFLFRLSESVLSRPVVGGVAMRRQIKHLVDISEHENVAVSVLPELSGDALNVGQTIVKYDKCIVREEADSRSSSYGSGSPEFAAYERWLQSQESALLKGDEARSMLMKLM